MVRAVVQLALLMLLVGVTSGDKASAQTEDLSALNRQVAQLYQAGKYSEAIPLAQRALALATRLHGPNHLALGSPLNNLALLYQAQGRYAEAEVLHKRDLAITEKALGPKHRDVGSTLDNLARLYQKQRRYAEAEPLYRRGVAIFEKALGPEHPEVGTALNNLAGLYQDQGRFAEAEPLYRRSLAIREKALGPEHPEVGSSLNNLASLYQAQGRFAEAEPLYRRSVAIFEKALGPEHPEVGTSLNNLALLYQAQGHFAEAEPLYRRSLAIREKVLGSEHPNVAQSLSNLALLYQAQGRYAEAEPLYRRSLAIREKALRPEHPDVGQSLNNLALLYRAQGRYAEAERLLKRTVSLLEKALGPEHPDLGTALNNLAELYRAQGRYAEAEPLYRRGLAITEKALGPEHPSVGTSLNNLASLFRDQGRYAEAEPLFKRSLAIREKALGPEHTDVAGSLNNLAELFRAQYRYAEAEPLYRRTVSLVEKALGPEHPDVGTALNNLALLLTKQGRYAEAEALYRRSLSIREKALGPDHPDVGNSLNNLAEVYGAQGRYDEAEVLYTRTLSLLEKTLGPHHPDVGTSLNNLAALAYIQSDWERAADYWRRSTDVIKRRAERGLSGGRGEAFGGEAQRWRSDFWGLIKASHRIAAQGTNAKLSTEMFETAQWAQGSEAASSLAAMAARSATGSPQLAGLVRERQDLVGEWQAKDKQLIAAKSEEPARRKAEAEKALADRLATIDTRLAQIDRRLAQDFPDYAALASPAPVSVTDVQAQLGADEALVLFLDTDDRFRPLPEETFIWVVTKSQVRWGRSDLGTAALTREVAGLRCGLDTTAWDGGGAVTCAKALGIPLDKAPGPDQPLPFDHARAHKLYSALFAEVRDLIKGKHLLIVPSGPLTQLPFQVLVTALPPGVIAGEVSREVGRLGAQLAPLTQEDRKTVPSNMVGGVRLAQPTAGGAAEAAGLRAGDILLALDQRGFATVQEAVSTIQTAGPGRNVSIELIRDGQRLTVSVTLGAVTVKDWKPLLLDADSARQTAWFARDHAITVLPAVSSLKALRRVGKPSTAPRPMIGFGNPLLDGPDERYAARAKLAREKRSCPEKRWQRTAALDGLRRGVSGIEMRGSMANVATIKRQIPLPETADELCAVAQDIKADARDIRLGAQATEREVKRLSAAGELAKYRMLHFATHGFLSGQLDGTHEPGLILTPPDTATEEDDGYLSASEIAALKLDADLVILSACNTAAGAATSAEALSGLARAFIYAQARALLVSHWEVYSGAAVKLITTTVREIARDPKVGRSEALRRSMLALIDKGAPDEAHPAYWAPFVVVGEGAATR